MVTQDGSLIEPSGTMSGGGGRPKGGRMRVGDAAPAVPSGANLRDALSQADFELKEVTGRVGKILKSLKGAVQFFIFFT